MSTTLISGEWHELNGSGREVYDSTNEGNEIVRMIRCLWSERYAIADTQCPFGSTFFGKQMMVCHRIEFEGVGSPAGGANQSYPGRWPEYQECTITATYAPPHVHPVPTSTGVNQAQQTWDISSEYLESGLSRTWKLAGTRIEEGATQAVLVPQCAYTYQVATTSPPAGSVIAMAGKVNQSQAFGVSAGHLLFTGAHVTQNWDESGDKFYDTTYNFIYRTRRWNEVWRAGRQKRDENGALMWNATTGDPVYVDGEAGVGGWDEPDPPLYEEADFSQLQGVVTES